jgi:2-oxoglutarate ferredoxin oxidoreductase subunit gamma
MTTTNVLMAGFGGQGMLLAGKVLAQAAMDEGLQVSWLPSYGPEMRGGTANVIVCLSSEPIASPLVASPAHLVVMNLPSLEKFGPRVRPGGVIVINATMVQRPSGRDDCLELAVDSRELARAAGSERSANFVMLGAWAAAAGVLPREAIERALAEEFIKKRPAAIEGNVAALGAGWEAGLALAPAGSARETTP